MRQLRWSQVCPGGDSIHIASVAIHRAGSTAPHCHDFYECFLVEGGTGTQTIGANGRPLARGELHFLRPEHAHGLAGGARPLAIVNVAFEASVFESVAAWHPFPRGVWSAEEGPRALALTTRQVTAFQALRADLGAGRRTAVDAAWFLLGLQRMLTEPAEGAGREELPEWCAVALPEAGEPGNLREGLPALVRLCGRSQEHVNRTFRRALNVTPTEWLNGERIRRARQLLETTRMPVLEISFECGFESPSYFHRRFREATGRSPREYRRAAMGVQGGL